MDEEIQKTTKKQRRELKRQEKKENALQQAKKAKIKSVLVWLLGGALIVGTIALLVLASNPKKGSPSNNLLDPLTKLDWVKGDESSKTSLVEYSDFECPACANFSIKVNELLNKYDGQIILAYRHFPLSYHVSGKLAMQAAEAAGNQGKFFAMHDLLFSRQAQWSNGLGDENMFTGYAKELGLNLDKFKQDYNAENTKKEIENDLNSGLKNGIESTPTFYVNNRKVILSNYGDLEQAVKRELGQ